MRTSSRNENVRIFCLAVSLMAHSARAMPHPGRGATGDGRRIPMLSLKVIVMLEACGDLGVLPWLRPPSKPPP